MSEAHANDTEPRPSETPAKPRSKPSRPRPPNLVNGIPVPRAAVRWRVWRFKDATGKSREDGEACAMPGPVGSPLEGRRIDWFPVKDFPPDWRFVLSQWGSGTYRLQFGAEEGAKGSVGWSAPVTFDDPKHPPLPAYRGAAAAPPPAAAPAAPPAEGMTVEQLLMSRAEGGKVDAAMVLLLLQLQQAQLAQLREWAAIREADDRRRRQELEDENRARLKARAEEFEQERKRTADFWAQESKRAIERAKEAASEGGGDDRFESLADSIETLAEKVESGRQTDREFWQGLVKEWGPAVLSRFLPQPMIAGGGNGSGS